MGSRALHFKLRIRAFNVIVAGGCIPPRNYQGELAADKDSTSGIVNSFPALHAKCSSPALIHMTRNNFAILIYCFSTEKPCVFKKGQTSTVQHRSDELSLTDHPFVLTKLRWLSDRLSGLPRNVRPVLFTSARFQARSWADGVRVSVVLRG